MTDNKHPIAPPDELVQEWIQSTRSNDCIGAYPANYEYFVATQAANWGADQELEACCKWLGDGRRENLSQVIALHAARRPKPPSLKEQALQALYRFDDNQGHEGLTSEQIADDFVLIRRALEALPDF